ncbi:isochorismatase [Spirochaetia bacterium]|nr:isochorismatase [Spirochaetia bacterium]
MRLALLVIDMQKAFYEGFGRESMDNAAKHINDAVRLFRKKNYPVVWIQNENRNDNFVPGSAGFDMIDALLKPADGEKRIVKRYPNSFNKTDLLEYLIREKIDTVVVTGYNAAYCVLSTYRGASDEDLTPLLIKNASASDKQENITFVEGICDLVSFRALDTLLG